MINALFSFFFFQLPLRTLQYEQLRLDNMARNARKMKELGLEDLCGMIGRSEKRSSSSSSSSRSSKRASSTSADGRDTSDAAPRRNPKRSAPLPLTYSEADSNFASTLANAEERGFPRGGRARSDTAAAALSDDRVSPFVLAEDLSDDLFPAAACRAMAQSPNAEDQISTLEKYRCARRGSNEDVLSFESVLASLGTIDVPETEGRHNVRRHNEGEAVRSMSTGVVPSRSVGGIQLAAASKQRPRLTRLLVAFGRAHIPDSEFRFNAITINKNYATAMHTDKFNLGPSFIVALGDFEGGGELWAHDIGAADVKCKFLRFDGNIPHCTIPWTSGERYSLVFYTNRAHSMMREFDRKYLVEELGFPLPHASVVGPVYRPKFQLPVDEKLAAAEEAFAIWETQRHNGLSERISTVGTVVHNIEIGKAKLIKSFHSDERVQGQSWSGAFVGTILYFQDPFFGGKFCK